MNLELTTRISGSNARAQFITVEQEPKYDTSAKKYITLTVESKAFSLQELALAVRKLIRTAQEKKYPAVSLVFSELRALVNENVATNEELLDTVAYNSMLASYCFETYKSSKSSTLELLQIVGDFSVNEKSVAKNALVIAQATNYARTLANTPACDMTPLVLAREARKLSESYKDVSCKVLAQNEYEKLGMGLFAAVGRGSEHESQFIVLEYNGGKKI